MKMLDHANFYTAYGVRCDTIYPCHIWQNEFVHKSEPIGAHYSFIGFECFEFTGESVFPRTPKMLQLIELLLFLISIDVEQKVQIANDLPQPPRTTTTTTAHIVINYRA